MSTQTFAGAQPNQVPPPAHATGDEPLISIRDLKVHFDLGGGGALGKLLGGQTTRRVVKAVDGVTLDIMPGETLGLVCGFLPSV